MIDTTTRSGMQVDGECGAALAACLLTLQQPCTPDRPCAFALPGAAAATGVAVAAFQKVASRLRGKHCVIIVCGGNMGSEGMQLVYEVAGAAGRA